MYFIMYNQGEEIIIEDIDQVMINIANGWRLYGFSDCEKLAYSLLHECIHY